MQKIRLAVLSDLHCHSKNRDKRSSFLLSDMPRKPKEQHPIASLIDLATRDDMYCDSLIVPGDFTDRVSEAGFHGAWSMVREVANSLGTETIIPTLGNHDIDSRGQHNHSSPFYIPKTLHDSFLFEDRQTDAEFWADGVTSLRVGGARFVVISSVADHFSEDSAIRGGVSSRQLSRVDTILEESDEEVKVAMCHHHPIQHHNLDAVDIDLMINGDKLIQLLSNHEVTLLVHGHKHYPRLRYGAGGNESLPVFAAGSLAAHNPVAVSNTRNTFHVITIAEVEPPDCVRPGTIDTWEFNYGHGWRRRHRHSADFPSTTGFGYRGRIQKLSNKCADVLTERDSEVMGWRDLLGEIEALKYVVPADFDQLRKALRDDHKIDIFWGESSPKMIGWVIGHDE